jgi:RNA polymerase sigma-70 factor (ECF subfamily)
MQRARAGDLEAFGELFDRHLARLQRFFYGFLGDAAAAEDAAQEVFWRLWQHRAAYERERPFGAWL